MFTWAVLAAVVVGAGLALVFTGNVDVPYLSAGDQEPEPAPGVGADMASVNEWEVSSQLNLPQSPNSADVYVFEEEPDNYGNYVDWDSSQATDGLSQGVDYYSTTGATSDSIDLGHIPSGDYFLVVEDDNYHTTFMEVSVPDEVRESFAENDQSITLAQTGDFDLTATYGSDNVVVYDDDGNVLNTGTDISDPSSNATRTVEIVREIEVDTGVSYLGKYDVTSFNDGDGIEEVDLTLEAGGHTCSVELKDGNSGELADSTSHGEDLDACVDAISDVETDPAQENSRITMTFDVTYDANTAVANAGDGEIGPGESMFTIELDDISGSNVGTDKSMAG